VPGAFICDRSFYAYITVKCLHLHD